MKQQEINFLSDLRRINSAPVLHENQKIKLLNELAPYLNKADWFTVGIMASSSMQAIIALKTMENRFNWTAMKLVTQVKENGPVFLKANQKTGDIHVRIEFGLGEGILLGCQYNEESKNADTLGPFPLNFFD
ncbi:DUF1824 family protein [Prochlorococcus marinus]|uniref:DUF1824 family protein n=1 Tax=Prochlorococcus marinus TaxID=1219 RepID=UPI0022B5E3B1|nr:DUF1824 family protein [Prochlorococcus marinus]